MQLKGSCIFGQSGGPTSVINASAFGVIDAALKNDAITKVYGAAHGIKGILDEVLYDMAQESPDELALLPGTPSSALGSCRYKLSDPAVDGTDYRRLLEVFKKYDVRYFFYNGGNDSMDTCNKISKYLLSQNYECRVIGVPKTIDNDLAATDHCPGFGSAAKYIATSCMEIALDARVYDTGTVTIVECMGRNAGWLTAAAALAGYGGAPGPDLVYLPELDFDVSRFVAQVSACYKEKGSCFAVISEGIHDAAGKFIAEYASLDASKTDSFGHKQMGGAAAFLAATIKAELGAKTRAIEFSLLQRCAAHCASQTDVDEAVSLGRKAVEAAVSGESDKMVAVVREAGCADYRPNFVLVDLADVANAEKTFPLDWITPDGVGIAQPFFDYAMPLIAGKPRTRWEDGLPRFARLAKVRANG